MDPNGVLYLTLIYFEVSLRAACADSVWCQECTLLCMLISLV